MTKIHKIVLLVIDHDDVGASGVQTVIESSHYPNHCIAPRVMSIETHETEWSDEHPLNHPRTRREVFEEMFEQ